MSQFRFLEKVRSGQDRIARENTKLYFVLIAFYFGSMMFILQLVIAKKYYWIIMIIVALAAGIVFAAILRYRLKKRGQWGSQQ